MAKKKLPLNESQADFGSAFSDIEFTALTPDIEETENAPDLEKPTSALVRVRLEKKGRSGKSVTVFYDFEPIPEGLAKLCKKLRSSIGVGGKYLADDQVIELQGDQRVKAAEILQKEGFTVKGQLQ